MSNPPIHSLDLNPLYINVHLTGFGPQGIQGPQGEEGSVGPEGPQGVPGTGQRTARVIVGSVSSGYTSSDCDFLCDGTDDQVEINAAIASLPFTEPTEEVEILGYVGGGEIILLDGQYNLTAPVVISDKPCTILRGSGPSTVLVRQWESIDDYEGVIQIVRGDYGVSWCRISDMTINGNGEFGLGFEPEQEPTGSELVSPFNCCIEGRNLYENVIDNVFCLNSPVGIFLKESSCYITRCWMGFCGLYGVYIEDDTGVSGVSIKDCEIFGGDSLVSEHPQSVGIYADDSMNMTIDSNMMYGVGTGIEAHDCTMMSIQNNDIVSLGTAVYAEGFWSIFIRVSNNFLIGHFFTDEPEPDESTLVLEGAFGQVEGNYIVAGQSYAGLYVSNGGSNIANNIIWGMYSNVGMYLEGITMSNVTGNIIIPMAGGSPAEETASIRLVTGMAVQLIDNTCAYGGIVADEMIMGGIKGNTCLGGELGAGIDLDSCFMVTIDGNNCQNKEYGLRMCSTLFVEEDEAIPSQLNTISNNIFCNNTEVEIILDNCVGNNINGNMCMELDFAVFGSGGSPAEYSILLVDENNHYNFITANYCGTPPVEEGGVHNLIINNFPHDGRGKSRQPLSTAVWSGFVENDDPALWTELFLDGIEDDRYILLDQSVHGFSLYCTALSFSDNYDKVKRWKLEGLIISGVFGDVVLVGDVTKTVIAQTDLSGGTDDWDVRVTADDTNKALKIEVLGEAGMDIRYTIRGEIETAWDEIPV